MVTHSPQISPLLYSLTIISCFLSTSTDYMFNILSFFLSLFDQQFYHRNISITSIASFQPPYHLHHISFPSETNYFVSNKQKK